MASTLELTVQRAVAAGVWPVVAEYHRSGQLLPTRSEGELRMPAEPVSASPRTYGEALGHALFEGPIRDAYAVARGDAPVRLWLCVEDPALRTWRWEWLCAPVDSTEWDFLTLDQRALYSLYLPSLTDRPYPPIGRRDLRALVVVANPADPVGRYGLTTFDAPAAVTRLAAVFGKRMSYDVLARVPEAIGLPTLDGLLTHLTVGAAAGPYSILHIVCHGRFDREADETWIYLEQPTADVTGAVPAHGIAATMLIERLRRVRQLPHFVYLSVCESGAPEAEQRLGGLAQRLVRDLGIPAVIGMTEPVTVGMAHALSDAFYKHLLQPSRDDIGAVDRALVEAYAGLAARLDVHVPALYSRLGDQPLFSPAVDRELLGGEIRAALEQLDALLVERAPVLRPKVAEHRHLLEPWLAADATTLTPDARQSRETSLQTITEICQEVLDISFHALAQGKLVPAYDGRQPFRGLSPFRTEDHEFFFGRDALICTLLRKLTDDTFLPVLGPSGSGKSSVVLAGLVRRLQRQHPHLQVAYLTPGSTPLQQLHAVQATIASGAVLYVIDQFEEVFTACRDEVQRRAFIDAVLALTTDHQVVLTMRADFWGECAPYPELRARMQGRQELIAPMTTAELRSAMEQQAAKVGLRFEADLSQTMLDEVAGEPGAMPLLQHTLLELWKRRHGRWLRAAEYRTVGGVKKAIAQTADRLYAELPATEQQHVRDIFLRLTQIDEQTAPGEERRDTRRRVPFSELVPAGTDPEATKQLVKRLADAVLVSTSRNSLTDQDEVEVAHEALIRHWKRLAEWLSDDKDRIRIRESVARASRDFETGARERSLLLHRGIRLDAARALLGSGAISLNAAEVQYLNACSEAEDFEQYKLRRRRRLAIGSLSAGFAVALILATTLLWQWRAAVGERTRAEQEARNARAAEYASRARALLSTQPDTAGLLALAAIRESDPRDETRWFPAGQAALRSALAQNHAMAFFGHGELRDASLELATCSDISERGDLLVAGHFNGTVHVWSVLRGREPRLLELLESFGEPLRNVWLSRGDRWLVTLTRSGFLRFMDVTKHITNGASVKFGPNNNNFSTFGDNNRVRSAVVAANRSLLAVAPDSGNRVELWRLDGPAISDRPSQVLNTPAAPIAISLTPTGEYVSVLLSDDQALVWQPANNHVLAIGPLFRTFTKDPILDRGDDGAAPSNIESSPNGRWLIVTKELYSTRVQKQSVGQLWEMRDGASVVRRTIGERETAIAFAQFSSDGRWLALAHDGIIQLWDLQRTTPAQTPSFELKTPQGRVQADGKWLDVGGEVYALTFDDQSSLLAVGDSHGAVSVWHLANLQTGQESPAFVTHGNYGRSIEFLRVARNGDWLLASGWNGLTALCNLRLSCGTLEPTQIAGWSADSGFDALIAAGGSSLPVLDTLNRLSVVTLNGPAVSVDPVNTRRINRTDTKVAGSSDGRWLLLFDQSGGALTSVGAAGIRSFAIDVPSLTDAVFDPKNHWLVISDRLQSKAWQISLVTPAPTPEPLTEYAGGGHLSFSAAGKWLVADTTTREQPYIRSHPPGLWRLNANRFEPYPLNTERADIGPLSISPDERWVVASEDKTSESQVMVWNIDSPTASKPKRIVSHRSRAAVTFAPNSSWAVTAENVAWPSTHDKTAILWRLSDEWREVRRFNVEGQHVDVTFSSSSRKVAIGADLSHDGIVADLSEDAGNVTATAKVTSNLNMGGHWDFDFSSDDVWLVTQKPQRLWHLQNGQATLIMEAQNQSCSAFSPDNKWMASSGETSTRLWNLRETPSFVELEGGGRPHFSRDSRRLAVVDDGLVRIHLVRQEDLRIIARSVIGRNMTWDEWRTEIGERAYEKTFPDLPVDATVIEATLDAARRAVETRDREAGRTAYRQAVQWAIDSKHPTLAIEIARRGIKDGFWREVCPGVDYAVTVNDAVEFLDMRAICRLFGGDAEGAKADLERVLQRVQQRSDFVELHRRSAMWLEELRRGNVISGDALVKASQRSESR
ncbi:MAG TPA: CHAT domain-containing protein [Thermoanaerobaculia bacterium]|nr:CHAT domain-containing protein [Thermoanaerobaculia bacterium]